MRSELLAGEGDGTRNRRYPEGKDGPILKSLSTSVRLVGKLCRRNKLTKCTIMEDCMVEGGMYEKHF